MNGLSILIYLANIVGKVESVMTAIIVTACIIGGISIFVLLVSSAESKSETAKEIRDNIFSFWKKYLFPVVIATTILWIVVPSERTIYMVAGSEITQELIDSETGRKVFELVDRKLDEFIMEVPKTNSP